MRIAVIYNEPKLTPTQEHWIFRSSSEKSVSTKGFTDASEYGVVEETEQIESFLRDAGYQTIVYAVRDVSELVKFLRQNRPDLVFNCCETFQGDARLEMNVAAIYEILGIPFTGSPSLALGIASNKSIAKDLFVSHGVPTSPWIVASPNGSRIETGRLKYPLIVKPLCEDASIGIDAHSIVESHAGLMERVRFVWEEFRQPALVEEYIPGRELNVAMLAIDSGTFLTLPISEIVFNDLPDQSYRILTYQAKWLVDSPYYRATVPRCPAQLSTELAERVRSVAVKAAKAVQLRDYGRIDLRIRASDDEVFVLEANPNPDITFDSGFVRAAEASGRTHASAVLEIVERAKQRMSVRNPFQ